MTIAEQSFLSSVMDGISYLKSHYYYYYYYYYSMTDGEEGSLDEPLTIEMRDMCPIADDASFLSNVIASHSYLRDVYFMIKSKTQPLLLGYYLLTTVTLSSSSPFEAESKVEDRAG